MPTASAAEAEDAGEVAALRGVAVGVAAVVGASSGSQAQ